MAEDESEFESESAPERWFSRAQAEELLPQIRPWLEQAMEQKKEVDKYEVHLRRLSQKILMSGGMIVDYEQAAGWKMRRDQAGESVRDALEHIHEKGCLVKDLEMGLVDFPAILDNQQVYLCWKIGEDAIRWWHRTDEGFAGRKPLDPHPPDSSKRRPM
jgi:hypothetical protein